MKKLICALLLSALLLTVPAVAEVVDNITVEASMPYSCEDFSLMLPASLHILEGDERKGFDAAILGDYPASSEMALMAVDDTRSAALCISMLVTDKGFEEAARGAARSLLGKDDSVVMTKFNEQDCACFGCAIGGMNYSIYVFDGAGRLVCVGICGLDDAKTTSLLTSLVLNRP